MSRSTKFIIWLTFIFVFTGCSSKPKVAHVKYHQSFDFSEIKKYSLYQRDHEFNEWQSISDAVRNDIEFAIENALDKQGYLFSSVESSDVVITYHLVSQSAHLKRYNNGVNYCAYCLIHGASGRRTERLGSDSGDIVLDMINVQTKRSIWRSSYPLNVKEKDNSQELQEKIHQAITLMLSQLNNKPNALAASKS